MKQFFSALVLLALSLALVGCGASGSTGSASESATASQAASVSGSAVFSAELQPETAVLAADEVVVTSQSSYGAPFCLRPEQDGTYHFSAITADDFVGSDYGYDHDAITWTIFVLDEEFTDGWRYLSQACNSAIQDLNGSVDIALKAGQYVYCLPSLNGFTGENAPDDSGVLTITPVEQSYVPGAENNYQLPITLNSETYYDLDGDGADEQICYTVQSAVLNGNVWSAASAALTINGTDVLAPYLEAALYLEDPEVPYYYIVDLNKGDAFCEVAITDWGYNDNYFTHYFRYAQGEVTYLGCVPGYPDDHTTVFYGDGRVMARTRLNVLQTWWGTLTYQLQGDAIVCPEGQFCEPDCEGMTVTLLRDIVVYTEPDLNSPTLTLSASAAPISFPSTDGQHWVEILCADGTTGWAYFSDFSTLVSGETSIPIWDELFDGLFLAG